MVAATYFFSFFLPFDRCSVVVSFFFSFQFCFFLETVRRILRAPTHYRSSFLTAFDSHATRNEPERYERRWEVAQILPPTHRRPIPPASPTNNIFSSPRSSLLFFLIFGSASHAIRISRQRQRLRKRCNIPCTLFSPIFNIMTVYIVLFLLSSSSFRSQVIVMVFLKNIINGLYPGKVCNEEISKNKFYAVDKNEYSTFLKSFINFAIFKSKSPTTLTIFRKISIAAFPWPRGTYLRSAIEFSTSQHMLAPQCTMQCSVVFAPQSRICRLAGPRVRRICGKKGSRERWWCFIVPYSADF